MKNLLTAAIAATLLSGCVPTTNLYTTPALYFGSSQAVPVTDSANQLSVSASVAQPVIAELKSEYRITKNILVSMSYTGNFGGCSHFNDNNVDYRYNTNIFDFEAGYIYKQNYSNKASAFIMAGYGSGHSTSIVPENDNSTEFIYKGNFSRFTITPGVDFAANKDVRFSISLRQSFIKFSKYELPDTVYSDKKQSLTDFMFRCSLRVFKKDWVHIFAGSFLNGTEAGNRQWDQKPEQWRIQRAFIGINFDHRFSLVKKQ